MLSRGSLQITTRKPLMYTSCRPASLPL